jgi:hypothetical protein
VRNGPPHRDAWYYLSAHHDLCGDAVLQTPAYHNAVEHFRLCPPCISAGPVPPCPAPADCADVDTLAVAADYLEHNETVCMVDCESDCLTSFHVVGSYHDCEGAFTAELDALYHHLEDVCAPVSDWRCTTFIRITRFDQPCRRCKRRAPLSACL